MTHKITIIIRKIDTKKNDYESKAHNTTQHNTTQHNTTQHNTTQQKGININLSNFSKMSDLIPTPGQGTDLGDRVCQSAHPHPPTIMKYKKK